MPGASSATRAAPHPAVSAVSSLSWMTSSSPPLADNGTIAASSATSAAMASVQKVDSLCARANPSAQPRVVSSEGPCSLLFANDAKASVSRRLGCVERLHAFPRSCVLFNDVIVDDLLTCVYVSGFWFVNAFLILCFIYIDFLDFDIGCYNHLQTRVGALVMVLGCMHNRLKTTPRRHESFARAHAQGISLSIKQAIQGQLCA